MCILKSRATRYRKKKRQNPESTRKITWMQLVEVTDTKYSIWRNKPEWSSTYFHRMQRSISYWTRGSLFPLGRFNPPATAKRSSSERKLLATRKRPLLLKERNGLTRTPAWLSKHLMCFVNGTCILKEHGKSLESYAWKWQTPTVRFEEMRQSDPAPASRDCEIVRTRGELFPPGRFNLPATARLPQLRHAGPHDRSATQTRGGSSSLLLPRA